MVVEFSPAQWIFTLSYISVIVIIPSDSSRRRIIMSKYIPGNQKHLTLNDRIYIENELSKGATFKDIAAFLCKDPTTISKEVRSRRLSNWYHKGTFYNAKNFCVHRYHCKKTNACGKIILCGIKCTSCPTCNQKCGSEKADKIQTKKVSQNANQRPRSIYQQNLCRLLFSSISSFN